LFDRDGKVSATISVVRDITERKSTEKELRIKENAIENAINAVAMSDMSGRITYVNKACMRLWGNNKKDELLGKPYFKLLQPQELSVAKEIEKKMLVKHA
jgi:PAS domain-containing protein